VACSGDDEESPEGITEDEATTAAEEFSGGTGVSAEFDEDEGYSRLRHERRSRWLSGSASTFGVPEKGAARG
jgi:hypothetical protein